MKAYTYIILTAVFLGILLSTPSCELTDANINPNSPTEVPANVLLPFIESRLASLMGTTPQVMAGIFMQYYEGVDNHPSQVQIYVINEALYVDWDWNDYYDGPMINLVKMIEVAETGGSYHYAGIGKIMMALILGNVSSTWGDVPYSEALYGSEISSPVFDSQQFIYETIQELLDDGIADLNQEYEGLKPTVDDIIFGGNMAKWKKTAYALKARYFLHLTKRSDDLNYDPAQEILKIIDDAISASDEDMEYPFGYSAAEYNPFYSYTLLNYILPNPTFTQLMSALNDPRKDFLYKKRFGVANLNGSFFTSSNSPVHMMTYHELKFIEAEARLLSNEDDPQAELAFKEAVKASIEKISSGTLDTAVVNNYINTHAVLQGSFEDKMKKLMQQKYIALFSSIESWTDFRRTGYPELTPNQGGDHNQNPGGDIPRRLAYPQTERLYNQNFPENLPNLQDRFWWDED